MPAGWPTRGMSDDQLSRHERTVLEILELVLDDPAFVGALHAGGAGPGEGPRRRLSPLVWLRRWRNGEPGR
jgi:hypothetical protein